MHRTQRMPRPMLATVGRWVPLAGGLIMILALSSAGPARLSSRTPAMITKALSLGPHAGDCERCHTMHAEDGVAEPHALVGPDDNTLCGTCHTTAPRMGSMPSVPWEGGSYPGPWLYAGSEHGSNPAAVWPGPEPPARVEPDAFGKCVNCHDPHGWSDALGPIPFLQLQRDEKLCLNCHDGSPAVTNVEIDQLKPFRHPTQDYSDRHTGALELSPDDFGVTPVNRRHAECVDCHNPHVARADASWPPGADASSNLLLGVTRVEVFNGPAGAAPTFELIAAQDTLSAPGGDWQLCFKCHSSWTTQPAGQTDLALVLNPNNPSYHPVEAVGADLGIAGAAFVPGWNATSRTRCGDCHGSDDPTARGPHGSMNPAILKRPYEASSDPRMMSPDESCFECHAYGVYADQGAPEFVKTASRFNEPGADKGHVKHVGEENVPCYACHATHGSTTQPHMIVTGRVPGIISYSETPSGGTCSPTCHEPESYDVNYAR